MQLLQQLKRAKLENRLDARLKHFNKYKLLIIDELGYLPIDAAERNKMFKKMEQRIYSEHQTQIFIETPYRNMKLVEDILKNCQNSTKLCIACDITLETEYIKTLSVSQWRKTTLPELGKRPTIFLLYK